MLVCFYSLRRCDQRDKHLNKLCNLICIVLHIIFIAECRHVSNKFQHFIDAVIYLREISIRLWLLLTRWKKNVCDNPHPVPYLRKLWCCLFHSLHFWLLEMFVPIEDFQHKCSIYSVPWRCSVILRTKLEREFRQKTQELGICFSSPMDFINIFFCLLLSVQYHGATLSFNLWRLCTVGFSFLIALQFCGRTI